MPNSQSTHNFAVAEFLYSYLSPVDLCILRIEKAKLRTTNCLPLQVRAYLTTLSQSAKDSLKSFSARQ
jgi:hypothetical protein